LDKWRNLRDKIHRQVCEKGYNAKKGCFVQSYGADDLDASLLLMPQVGFLPGSDPRVKATVEAIERELMPDGFVQRYNTAKVKDGLPPGEGVFLACSFWMVSSLKAIGREEDARKLFDRLLTLCNDLGLLSEEYDPKHKRLVGNFPQAFSHIALVNAACDIEQDGAALKRGQSNPKGPVQNAPAE
jgi:GH15 family glucan-1,4-alpha-glucosidase